MNQLKKLSDVELEKSFGVHVDNERMSLDQIYAHINEVQRREIHLDHPYGNMKTYLVKRWKYSERDAYRKIDGARLLQEVPYVAAEIRNGNLNADVIGEVSRAVKEKERKTGEKVSVSMKSELVKMVSGKTVGQSQHELAAALDIKVKEFETKRVQQDKSVRLGVTVSETLNDRIKICQDHASHKIQQENMPHTLESMLKILTDYYIKGNKLDEHSDEKAKPAPSAKTVVRENNKNEKQKTVESKEPKKLNKTLTPKTRREVFKRDKCCQYVNKATAEICGETAFMQVDHKTSLWAGGTHEMRNLQALCANHNRRKYMKEARLTWL